ncbi:MAG: GatB/YqeY domain-containing protein, partial [Anaerolineae bacterium]
MTLKERLTEDLKEAMRAKDERRKTTLRLLLDAIHKAEIPSKKEAEAGEGAQRKRLSEDEILRVVASEAKRRRDAITEFGKAEREDLVAQEEAELAIIMGYLPAQLSREEIETLAREV